MQNHEIKMKYITRTIRTTAVSPKLVRYENGGIYTETLPDFTIEGEVKDSEILRECRKRFGKMANYAYDVETVEKRYKMDIETFIAHAEEMQPDEVIDEE